MEMSNLRTNLIKENGGARSIKVSNRNVYLYLYVTFRSLVNGNLISTTNSRNSNCLLITANRNGVDRRIQCLRLLGDLLGIDDYATNMASFWFLDTLVLYMIRYRENLDEYYMSVLVSWLAGEIRLLRDRKHTREGFFRDLKNIFIAAANKISEQKQMPYWDEIVDEREAGEEIEERLSTGNQSIRSLREPSSQADIKLSGTIDPVSVLDIVIEATYDMYANELRYALVYAVFVEPIEIETYNLPFTFRTPRPVKPADPKMIPFNMQLQRSLKKIETMDKSKKDNKAGKKLKTNYKIPPTPPPSLDDEVMLLTNRLFILPLIEANESSEIFETPDA
ncbi:uncharacterized protein LOC117166289 isoform X1 [Bombus vancouverensis nearcticus]|uniref:uncharacterized protein LOC117166289 isoform X1 n=1 Tax=Bombus vancouverensis nearcticus TaxID=2705178 RepID=UPI00402BB875